MTLLRLTLDPDQMLDRAIKAWMRRGDKMPLPSRVDSHVDLEKSQVVLENCNGFLGSYRILASGRLRWE